MAPVERSLPKKRSLVGRFFCETHFLTSRPARCKRLDRTRIGRPVLALRRGGVASLVGRIRKRFGSFSTKCHEVLFSYAAFTTYFGEEP